MGGRTRKGRLLRNFCSLPGDKEKESYERWEREGIKSPHFCQFALKSLNSLAKRDRGRSVQTERGNNRCAARKAGHNLSTRWLCCYLLILSYLFHSPPPPTLLLNLSSGSFTSQCKHVLIFTILKWDSACPSSYRLLSLLPLISELTTHLQWAWSLSSPVPLQC